MDSETFGKGNCNASSATASRKAGEILKFALDIGENDLVLACERQNVLGVGRVRGSYEYDGGITFPHKHRVEWLLHQAWQMPDQEGLRTTVWELGKSAPNLLELENNLFRSGSGGGTIPRSTVSAASSADVPLPPLDPFSARLDGILSRKGQVVLYGPPGTGKTYRALKVTKDLAARRAFRKTFADLSKQEKAEIEAPGGLVRLCTFHPGYGYEDFLEGLRPKTIGGQMVFEPRDGIFKQLCADAERRSGLSFFLVVDEINRGDLPRIFGELITVIEQDKRGSSIILPISGLSFVVPSNVYLVGTMNTADRSISLLDTAIRRRFGFVELMPDSSQLAGRTAGGLPLGPWLDALNTRLRRHLKRDARNLQIGHAYLMPPQPITSMPEFARVLRDDIIPLLEEYCYDDFGTLRDIRPKLPAMPLTRLLRYTYGLRDITTVEETRTPTARHGLHDLLIAMLAGEIDELLHRGLARRYVSLSEELESPRGRILVQELIRKGGIREAQLPCQYFERRVDWQLNRVLRAGVDWAGQMTEDRALRRSMHRLSGMFGDVAQKARLEFEEIDRAERGLTRLTAASGPALTIIRLLLGMQGVVLESIGEPSRMPGFLFDMNIFFQRLLSRFLHDNLTGQHIVDEWAIRNLFIYAPDANPRRRRPPQLRPDYALFLSGNSLLCFLDAKYRDIWGRGGLPTEWLYQLSIYALASPVQVSVLLYASMDKDACDERVDLRQPVSWSSSAPASVIIRPVVLQELADLLDPEQMDSKAAKRQRWAKDLVALRMRATPSANAFPTPGR